MDPCRSGAGGSDLADPDASEDNWDGAGSKSKRLKSGSGGRPGATRRAGGGKAGGAHRQKQQLAARRAGGGGGSGGGGGAEPSGAKLDGVIEATSREIRDLIPQLRALRQRYNDILLQRQQPQQQPQQGLAGRASDAKPPPRNASPNPFHQVQLPAPLAHQPSQPTSPTTPDTIRSGPPPLQLRSSLSAGHLSHPYNPFITGGSNTTAAAAAIVAAAVEAAAASAAAGTSAAVPDPPTYPTISMTPAGLASFAAAAAVAAAAALDMHENLPPEPLSRQNSTTTATYLSTRPSHLAPSRPHLYLSSHCHDSAGSNRAAKPPHPPGHDGYPLLLPPGHDLLYPPPGPMGHNAAATDDDRMHLDLDEIAAMEFFAQLDSPRGLGGGGAPPRAALSPHPAHRAAPAPEPAGYDLLPHQQPAHPDIFPRDAPWGGGPVQSSASSTSDSVQLLHEPCTADSQAHSAFPTLLSPDDWQ